MKNVQLFCVFQEGGGERERERPFSRQKEYKALKELVLKPGYICCAKERLDCLSRAVVH
jgi:hypothetical protein